MNAKLAVWEESLQPPAEQGLDTMPKPAETSIDVTRLSVPIQVAILVAGIVLSSLLSIWATQRSADRADLTAATETKTAIVEIKGNLSVIIEQQKSATEVARMRDEARVAQMEAVKADITDTKRQMQMIQIQVQGLQLELAKGKR